MLKFFINLNIKIMRTLKLSMFILFNSIVLVGGNAQDCKALVQDLFAWSKASAINEVNFKLVMLDQSRFWGQYTEGKLKFYETRERTTPTGIFPATKGLSGDAKQYFSDRMVQCPTPTSGTLGSTQYWFAKQYADDLNLSISLNSSNDCNTPVTYTLKTWNNSGGTFCATCQNGFMYLMDIGAVIVFKKSQGPR
jgi:hypothetical protein